MPRGCESATPVSGVAIGWPTARLRSGGRLCARARWQLAGPTLGRRRHLAEVNDGSSWNDRREEASDGGPMDRRQFLRSGLVGGAGLVAASQLSEAKWAAALTPGLGPFRHVRRVTRCRAASSSGRGLRPTTTPFPARALATTWWSCGRSPSIPTSSAWWPSGSTVASAVSDHTVEVDVAGLAPGGQHYYYRFRAQGQRSPVGRAKTAPAADVLAPSLRLGLVSCANCEGGYFAAYRHLAARDDLDFVLHVGDYIYEYPLGPTGRVRRSDGTTIPPARSSPCPTTGGATPSTRPIPTCRRSTPAAPGWSPSTTTTSRTTRGGRAPRTTSRRRAISSHGAPPRSRRTASGCRSACPTRPIPTASTAGCSWSDHKGRFELRWAALRSRVLARVGLVATKSPDMAIERLEGNQGA